MHLYIYISIHLGISNSHDQKYVISSDQKTLVIHVIPTKFAMVITLWCTSKLQIQMIEMTALTVC